MKIKSLHSQITCCIHLLLVTGIELVKSPLALADDPTTVHGLVMEKGTRKPLGAVNVYCSLSPGKPPLKEVTQSDGKFAIQLPTAITPFAPAPSCHWIINLAGYDRFEAEDAEFTQNAPHEFYIEKSNYQIYETTVYGQTEKRDDNTKSITALQINHLAGGGNDPIKAVQNLPGVARSSFLGSNIAIEGSSSNDTQYFVDNIDVPIILHFSGIYSIINAGALDRIDFLPAGFGPEYSRSSAGYVGVWTKQPATDRLHGTGYFDIFNAGALVEGPTGKDSSFLVGARTTYIGPIFGLLAKNNSNFNLTAIPDFSDFIGVYQSKLSDTDSFKVVTIGSRDTFGFVLPQPTTLNTNGSSAFSLMTAFFRIIPQYTHRFSDTSIGRLSFGIGKDWIFQNIARTSSNINSVGFSARAEWEVQPTDGWKTYIGLDDKASINSMSLTVPFRNTTGGVFSPIAISTFQQTSINNTVQNFGIYWRNVIHASNSPWTISPGVRADYYSPTNEYLPAPRLALKYEVSPSFNLHSAGGLYTQPALPQQVDPNIGNPNLKSSQTWHLTLGAEKDLRDQNSKGWTLNANLFYKHFKNVITTSSALVTRPDGSQKVENYNNSGLGRAYGLETQAKFTFDHQLSGWISYTLSRSTRAYPPASEALFSQDQTHILSTVGSMDLGGNYLFSARIRYVTGSPYTPIVGGTFDADNDLYIPISGVYYSQRGRPFFQIDSRIEKKWIYKTWILTAYLDILNVTNSKNQEGLLNSYDYTQTAVLSGVPILPTFGLKGEF